MNFKLATPHFYEYMNDHDKRAKIAISLKAAIDKLNYSLRIVFVLKCHTLAYPNVNSQGCLAICVALVVLL